MGYGPAVENCVTSIFGSCSLDRNKFWESLVSLLEVHLVGHFCTEKIAKLNIELDVSTEISRSAFS